MEIFNRIFGNMKSTMTALGMLGLILVALEAQYPTVKWIGVAATVISIVYKVLSQDVKDQRPVWVLAVMLLGASAVYGQAPAPKPAATTVNTGVFALSGEAIGVSIGNQWGVGADAIQALPVTNTFSVEGHQVIVQQIDFQGYYGGLNWTPDLKSLIAKTKLPANTFQPFFHFAGGISRNAAGQNNPSGFAGGGIRYSPSQDGSFSVTPVRVDYLYSGGFGASPSGIMVSAGMSYIFGK